MLDGAGGVGARIQQFEQLAAAAAPAAAVKGTALTPTPAEVQKSATTGAEVHTGTPTALEETTSRVRAESLSRPPDESALEGLVSTSSGEKGHNATLLSANTPASTVGQETPLVATAQHVDEKIGERLPTIVKGTPSQEAFQTDPNLSREYDNAYYEKGVSPREHGAPASAASPPLPKPPRLDEAQRNQIATQMRTVEKLKQKFVGVEKDISGLQAKVANLNSKDSLSPKEKAQLMSCMGKMERLNKQREPLITAEANLKAMRERADLGIVEEPPAPPNVGEPGSTPYTGLPPKADSEEGTNYHPIGAPDPSSISDPAAEVATAAPVTNPLYAPLDGVKELPIPKGHTLVDGNFLGKGTFGQVSRLGVKGPDGKAVSEHAIKTPVIPRGTSIEKQEEIMKEFVAECVLLNRIPHHPNVVRFDGITPRIIYDAEGQPIEKIPGIVMEAVNCGSADKFLQSPEGLNLNIGQRAKLCRDVAAGMQHLAQSGVIHRDLAARNILIQGDKVPVLDASGQPVLKDGKPVFETVYTAKINDFGLSRVSQAYTLKKGEAKQFEGYKSRSDIGPVKWMAPEAFQRTTTTQSDVWSFGAVMVEMLTGKPPYPDVNAEDFAPNFRVLTADGSIFRSVDAMPASKPEIAQIKAMKQIMGSCFHLEPGERPTFVTLVKQLDTYIAAQPKVVDEGVQRPVSVRAKTIKTPGDGYGKMPPLNTLRGDKVSAPAPGVVPSPEGNPLTESDYTTSPLIVGTPRTPRRENPYTAM